MAALSVFVAIVAWLLGALDPWSDDPGESVRTTAKVLIGVECDESLPETVAYIVEGVERRGSLDACGHRAGETVDVAVTGDTLHLAEARVGSGTDIRPVGLVLVILAGMAGAGFTELFRRPGGP